MWQASRQPSNASSWLKPTVQVRIRARIHFLCTSMSLLGRTLLVWDLILVQCEDHTLHGEPSLLQ